ncbi:MAG: Rrf2 family transcriptional regulator [Acidobacteriaceae bacterium]|nr:Rrf2 family transcriptional regulator [Acidobacteriaceae bacterium]
MQLRNQVEWALHCAAILAAVPEERFLPARDLAEMHGVPKEYLSKALQALAMAGLVSTTLGPSGGYRLARAPKQITFLDVVDAIEGSGRAFVCTEIRKNNPCRPSKQRDAAPCAIARVMWGAEEAWRKKLRKVTLADLLETLEEDVDAKTLAKTAEWVQLRC